ncbi:MAG: hypothetical protein HYR85_13675 [Planctomycetes bacterium]|nr:hypothetical protein [Planctomycetota bacterium]MBI3844209.1 hypothetical protein [Planctomycetota bacterium]
MTISIAMIPGTPRAGAVIAQFTFVVKLPTLDMKLMLPEPVEGFAHETMKVAVLVAPPLEFIDVLLMLILEDPNTIAEIETTLVPLAVRVTGTGAGEVTEMKVGPVRVRAWATPARLNTTAHTTIPTQAIDFTIPSS